MVILKPPMTVFTKRDWRGTEHLLVDGALESGIVVSTNHISWFDPLEMAHVLNDNGRPPRFLGKESVFRVPVVGRIIAGAGQIPVYRESRDAYQAVRAAIAAAEAGECVVVYPEGTISREPSLWPMRGKSGAVRIALAADVPLVPAAQWGAQEVIGPYRKELRLLPRKTMQVRFGPPVDLDDLRGRPLDATTLDAATERLMDAITELLEQIRGEQAPPERFDIAAHRRAQAALQQPAATDQEEAS
jgi:1-acyl-sn-glycerol-3-phosphate acyltransferase